MLDQVCGSFRHPPGVAREADGAALTGEGDQEIMTALPATRPRKTVGQNAALQVGTQLPLGMGRDALIFPVVVTQGEKGFQVILQRTVKRCVGGATAAVRGGCASLRLDSQVRIPNRVEKL
jgi:hypothetical protein